MRAGRWGRGTLELFDTFPGGGTLLSRSAEADLMSQPNEKPMASETAELMRMVFKMVGEELYASRMAVIAAAMSFAPKVVEPATMTFAPAA